MRHALAICAAAIVVVPGQVVLASSDSAEGPSEPEQITTTSAVTVETFSADNKTLLSTKSYGQATQGMLMGADASSKAGAGVAKSSGSGGSSSASGCRKVTVKNKSETVLGITVYHFNTWTRWCWTRSAGVVRDVTSGWFISDVDSQYYWKGITNKELGFYDYSTNDAHPVSAYKNYRQGQFENCVLRYVCIGAEYPANTLRSYSNGIWVWKTN
jgi:hypothetical protein